MEGEFKAQQTKAKRAVKKTEKVLDDRIDSYYANYNPALASAKESIAGVD